MLESYLKLYAVSQSALFTVNSRWVMQTSSTDADDLESLVTNTKTIILSFLITSTNKNNLFGVLNIL